MEYKEVKELIRIFNKSVLNKLKLKKGDFEILLEKEKVDDKKEGLKLQPPASQDSYQNTAISGQKENASKTGEYITSPMVGTFYRAPSPDSPPFVKEGDKVSKGQTLCIIEAMKIFNEIEAEFDCKILEILVEDGQPIEYDMPLFLVEKL